VYNYTHALMPARLIITFPTEVACST